MGNNNDYMSGYAGFGSGSGWSAVGEAHRQADKARFNQEHAARAKQMASIGSQKSTSSSTPTAFSGGVISSGSGAGYAGGGRVGHLSRHTVPSKIIDSVAGIFSTTTWIIVSVILGGILGLYAAFVVPPPTFGLLSDTWARFGFGVVAGLSIVPILYLCLYAVVSSAVAITFFVIDLTVGIVRSSIEAVKVVAIITAGIAAFLVFGWVISLFV